MTREPKRLAVGQRSRLRRTRRRSVSTDRPRRSPTAFGLPRRRATRRCASEVVDALSRPGGGGKCLGSEGPRTSVYSAWLNVARRLQYLTERGDPRFAATGLRKDNRPRMQPRGREVHYPTADRSALLRVLVTNSRSASAASSPGGTTTFTDVLVAAGDFLPRSRCRRGPLGSPAESSRSPSVGVGTSTLREHRLGEGEGTSRKISLPSRRSTTARRWV